MTTCHWSARRWETALVPAAAWRAPRRRVTLGLITFTGVVLVAAHMSASSGLLPHAGETAGPTSTADRQVHVLVWTQQRSGSTLTSGLLCASPRTFCSMEPLRHREREGSGLLGDIFRCRFSQRPVYFRDWMHGPQINDLRVRELCQKPLHIMCETPDVVEAVCRAATANIIKVVSVNLSVGAPLLQELRLTTRVIHLVRDPRALLASRLLVEEGHFLLMLNGTFFSREAKDARLVCERYRQDLHAARRLLRLYPER
ncbi:Carbohydrate sulfotransferase 5 [Portunus trituberculatus]|uniref:Carbohydrate sulfotransferase 5 n=2 Tax=Portunus trituberculatus TaxID=210409 RepID=A0A5B7HQV3_PORTR|nr:Carbohydrate sulfotransferase 5 [Portunus trituberculatus]